ANDLVTLDGSAYIALVANTNSEPPSANWERYVAAGADGTMTSIVPGTFTTVDATDPANPEVDVDPSAIAEAVASDTAMTSRYKPAVVLYASGSEDHYAELQEALDNGAGGDVQLIG